MPNNLFCISFCLLTCFRIIYRVADTIERVLTLEMNRPGFNFKLYHSRTSHLTSLGLCFLIYKMGIVSCLAYPEFLLWISPGKLSPYFRLPEQKAHSPSPPCFTSPVSLSTRNRVLQAQSPVIRLFLSIVSANPALSQPPVMGPSAYPRCLLQLIGQAAARAISPDHASDRLKFCFQLSSHSSSLHTVYSLSGHKFLFHLL